MEVGWHRAPADRSGVMTPFKDGTYIIWCIIAFAGINALCSPRVVSGRVVTNNSLQLSTSTIWPLSPARHPARLTWQAHCCRHYSRHTSRHALVVSKPRAQHSALFIPAISAPWSAPKAHISSVATGPAAARGIGHITWPSIPALLWLPVRERSGTLVDPTRACRQSLMPCATEVTFSIMEIRGVSLPP